MKSCTKQTKTETCKQKKFSVVTVRVRRFCSKMCSELQSQSSFTVCREKEIRRLERNLMPS